MTFDTVSSAEVPEAEIEVTPAMSDAGAAVLDEYVLNLCDGFEPPAEVAQLVYRAMERARRADSRDADLSYCACAECLELLMSAAKAWRNAAKKVSASNRGSKEGLACNTAYTEAQLKLADVIDAITIKDKLPRREDEPDLDRRRL